MKSRMMGYATVSCESPKELDDGVNKRIQEGWQPYKSPYTSSEIM